MIRLAILDVDGVLTMFKSAWQYLHAILGVSHIAKANYEAYRARLIDYRDWAFVDLMLWYGTSRRWSRPKITLRPGALELLELLRKNNVYIMAVSGGLDFTGDVVGGHVDEYVSNRMIYRGDSLVSVEVNVEGKDYIIKRVEEMGFSWNEVLAIGDSEIDIPLLSRALYSIAYNPLSDAVARAARVTVNSSTLYPVVDIVNAWLKYT